MNLVFIHGWSVTHTNTYGDLPKVLAKHAKQFDIDLKITHIQLGSYISFNDEVTLDDLAVAFNHAISEHLKKTNNVFFSCITHSTGGPLIRLWVEKFYGKNNLARLPLKHLIMLAPANHGSALAQLGKSRLGRLKSLLEGVEPGMKILDWLELGSDGQQKLNQSVMDYQLTDKHFFPFVIIGETIDEKMYDFINPYTAEKGSDGVIRSCAANLNYTYYQFVETDQFIGCNHKKLQLVAQKKPFDIPFAVIPGVSHSGDKLGIMRSVKLSDKKAKPVVEAICHCLQVNHLSEYKNLNKDFQKTTTAEQQNKDRYCMLILEIMDEEGTTIDDYDFILLSGKQYNPNTLPMGFFVDRQKNQKTKRLIYYLNYDRLHSIKDGKIGFRIIIRPDKGFVYYHTVEFRSEELSINDFIKPNEVTYLSIQIARNLDQNLCDYSSADKKAYSFKRRRPTGKTIP